jgi:hypothetical protein
MLDTAAVWLAVHNNRDSLVAAWMENLGLQVIGYSLRRG